jgi:hypothetical protein
VPLLSVLPRRYVLLLVDDRAGTVATRLESTDLAVEVVECRGDEEACHALVSGRRYSAVVAHRVAPELLAAARRAGIPLVTVASGMAPEALARAIEAQSTPVPRVDHPAPVGSEGPPATGGPDRGQGLLIAVCGPGGTGVSTLAAALVDALASRSPNRDLPAPAAHSDPPTGGQPAAEPRRVRVVLADLALRADQAYLHGVGETGRGLVQLGALARFRPITARDLGRHTVALDRWHLLPGLRRPGHWTAVGPLAFDEVLTGLLRHFDVVVADITGDFEGEADSGAIEVEERNHMARQSARTADVVVVVGGPGANGTRRLESVVNDLLDLGVDPARIQPARCWPHPDDPIRPGDPLRICGLPAAPIAIGPGSPGSPVGPSSPPASSSPSVPGDPGDRVAAALAELLSRLPATDYRPAWEPVTPGSLGSGAR